MSRGTKIFVGRIPSTVKPSELESLFSMYGVVTECDILSNYGFVHMSTPEESEAAIDALNNYVLHGSSISVEASTSTGRKGGGGLGGGSRMRTLPPRGATAAALPLAAGGSPYSMPMRPRIPDQRLDPFAGAPRNGYADPYAAAFAPPPPPPPYAQDDYYGRYAAYDPYRRAPAELAPRPLPPAPAPVAPRPYDPYDDPYANRLALAAAYDRRPPPPVDPYDRYMAAPVAPPPVAYDRRPLPLPYDRERDIPDPYLRDIYAGYERRRTLTEVPYSR